MPPSPAAGRRDTARNALVIIAVILTGGALVWLAPILTPLALAIFLMLVIDAVARDLHERLPRLRSDAALAAAIAVIILVFGVTFYFLASHAAGFIGKLLGVQPRLDLLLRSLAHSLHVRLPRTVAGLLASLEPAKYLPAVASAVQGVLQQGLLVLLYLGFLLASRRGFERKAVRLFQGRVGRHEALQVFLRVRDSIERYLYIQTVCCAFIAIGSWALMTLVGLENAFFWALLIFALGFIPIIGAAIGIVAPTLFALVQFATLWQGLALGAGLLAIAFVVGNILMPRLQGRSLNIDPVILLLSLAFWGAVWGGTGMFLSTPLTLLVMVILAQFDSSRWIAVLISADGDPQSIGSPPLSAARSRKSEASALQS